MLFVSVVAGLSAFAVILMVGAVAMRRKQRAAPPIETGKKETAPSPNKEELNKEYSDPILSWMAKTPAGPKTGVSDDIQIDQDDSEATIISVHEEEPSRIEKQPLDLGHSYESETSAEKDGDAPPVEEQLSESVESPTANVRSSEPLEEEEVEAEVPSNETPVAPVSVLPVTAEKAPEQEVTKSRKTSRSSRARTRRKGRRRRRRR